MDDLGEGLEVSCGGLVVCAAFIVGQQPPIGLDTMKHRVDPLRGVEEVLRSFDHDPALVDPHTSVIGDEGSQHLGNAAALGGRVDVPEHASPES